MILMIPMILMILMIPMIPMISETMLGRLAGLLLLTVAGTNALSSAVCRCAFSSHVFNIIILFINILNIFCHQR